MQLKFGCAEPLPFLSDALNRKVKLHFCERSLFTLLQELKRRKVCGYILAQLVIFLRTSTGSFCSRFDAPVS